MSAIENTCHGCGCAIPKSKGGTPRKWCGQKCRRDTLYRGVCETCGKSTYNGTTHPPTRCVQCGNRSPEKRAALRATADHSKRAEIVRLWNQGVPMSGICEAVGITFGNLAAQMNRMRRQGYDLPYRYQAWARKAKAL